MSVRVRTQTHGRPTGMHNTSHFKCYNTRPKRYYINGYALPRMVSSIARMDIMRVSEADERNAKDEQQPRKYHPAYLQH